MSNEFHRGDIVKWNTSQGSTKGHVIKKLTEDCKIDDYDVKASEDNPKYLVETCESEERANPEMWCCASTCDTGPLGTRAERGASACSSRMFLAVRRWSES